MPGRDTGLRTMLLWTFAALVVTLFMTYVAVQLVVHFFDRP
jgi:hypothetical protein